MFQAIYNVHLKDRLRGKRLKSRFETHRISNPYFTIAAKQRADQMIGITNLFILATAALATIIPRETSALAQIHLSIDEINSGLATISNDIKNFNATAILSDLESISSTILQAGRDVAGLNGTVSESEALVVTYYVRNAMQPAVDETILDLRKAKQKLNRAGVLENVAEKLEDLGSFVIVLGAALLSKTPESKKADAQEVLDGIVTTFRDAVKALRS
ncbi:hypothetical protein CB0940_12044 [Cercospora beticola]|uniref:Uncharacterized protein n=1 Tax=Cercospora beticola TaxID=122368 RepID=A0A2G5IDK7_CERBT|nr:hypothetical protein CB0940_12044 [Cercospora beticola]PIB02936.1 hypothetical protein CB0940_12044 [Cercospora beticola]WPB04430.1 hypothetical protein RHO25_009076 [Cercospora beticola]